MKVNIFVSAVGGLFLKLIYHGACTVVHFLLLKFSMIDMVRLSLTRFSIWANLVTAAFKLDQDKTTRANMRIVTITSCLELF